MELDPKRFMYMSVGFFDYLREKLDEMSEEFIERGQQKGEDVREFIDDIVENIPFLKPKEYESSDDAESGKSGGLLDFLSDIDVKSAFNDLLTLVGLKKDASDDVFDGESRSDA